MVQISIIALLALAASSLALTPGNAGAANVGNGQGKQFTTGGCIDNADCQSACCAGGATAAVGGGNVGICSAEAVGDVAPKTGCGFVDPNKEATLAAAKKQVAKQGFKRSPVV